MKWTDRMRLAAGLVFSPKAANELRRFANIEEAMKHAARGGLTGSGMQVTHDSAQRVAAVYACVRILRETISHLPLIVYKSDGVRREPAVEHPVYRLLKQQPNEWQTAMEFRELLESDVDMRGNGYALKVMGVRGVQELVRFHPDRMEVAQNADLSLTYVYTRPDGRRVPYRQDEIFHLRGFGSDGIKGQNPIQVHRETIGDSIAMQRHGSKVFSNGARPSAILEAEGEISSESRQALKDDFEEMYAGVDNHWRPAIMPNGITFKPVSMNLEDAQYIEARKFTRSEIFAIFGVPPHKGGDLERATFSNIEHQALEFVQDAIVPRCVRWEQAIERDLLEDGFYARHNVKGLLRGDAKSRAEAQNLYRRMGVYSANEIRAMEDMNPREDEAGDEYIVEMNMRPDDGSSPETETAQ